MDYIASVSWLNVPRVVKSNDPAVQSNVQPFTSDGDGNDVRVFASVLSGLAARKLTHIASALCRLDGALIDLGKMPSNYIQIDWQAPGVR